MGTHAPERRRAGDAPFSCHMGGGRACSQKGVSSPRPQAPSSPQPGSLLYAFLRLPRGWSALKPPQEPHAQPSSPRSPSCPALPPDQYVQQHILPSAAECLLWETEGSPQSPREGPSDRGREGPDTEGRLVVKGMDLRQEDNPQWPQWPP